MKKKALGLYLHIPFCTSRCRYCDFYSSLAHHRIPDFLSAIKKEMEVCEEPQGISIESLYFGGGTPSILDNNQISELFQSLHSFFDIQADAEITFEANPGSLYPEKLKNLKSLGVNRLSLGLQSLFDKKLLFLGRSHTAMEGRYAFEMARDAGFDNISLDFIYGLPGEILSSWQKELEEIAAIQAEHLSLYMLGIERETPMGRDLALGHISGPDEHLVADLFDLTLSMTETLGYPWYEVSNFAKDGKFRSRHNQGYWENRPWFALGPSSHGFLDSMRFANVRSLEEYIRILLEEGRLPREMEENITPEKARIEALYLGFRTRKGIPLDSFDKRFGVSFLSDYGKLIERNEKKGFLLVENGFCRLTEHGLRFLDAITADFVAAL